MGSTDAESARAKEGDPVPARTLLLSIRPRFAKSIFKGTKKVELRRKCPRILESHLVFLYVSSPVSAIAGGFELGRVLTGTPRQVWPIVRAQAGITPDEFREYFAGASQAVALFFTEVWRFSVPIGLSELRRLWPRFHPPQSYVYLRPEDMERCGFRIVDLERCDFQIEIL